jgi:hypothetical protein
MKIDINEIVKNHVDLLHLIDCINIAITDSDAWVDYTDEAFDEMYVLRKHLAGGKTLLGPMKQTILSNKDRIIKYILTLVKTGAPKIAARNIETLEIMGIDWPELNAIEQSIRASNENR